jgi:phospholipid transport system substrate-binding protein
MLEPHAMSRILVSRRGLAALCLAGLLAGAAAASAANGAEALIDRLTKEAVRILRTTEAHSRARAAGLRAILERGFDLPYLARLAVGRSWRDLSDGERREFTRIFTHWALATQSTRLGRYAGEDSTVEGSQPAGRGDTMVATRIRGGKLPQPIQVDWRVREEGGAWRVIDVVVEGVSMVITCRGEFQAIVDRGGVAALQAELAAQAGRP